MFFTVASLTISLSIFTYYVFVFISPADYLSTYIERDHATNESFKNRYLSKYDEKIFRSQEITDQSLENSSVHKNDNEKILTEEEITEKRLQSLSTEVVWKKNQCNKL